MIVELLTSIAQALRIKAPQHQPQEGAVISGSYTDVSFANCDLRDHVLSGDFIDCTFRGADLRGAVLRGHFIGVCFVGAKLQGTMVDQATFLDCEPADLFE